MLGVFVIAVAMLIDAGYIYGQLQAASSNPSQTTRVVMLPEFHKVRMIMVQRIDKHCDPGGCPAPQNDLAFVCGGFSETNHEDPRVTS